MPSPSIDLNCDVGEGAEPFALAAYVTSVNVACGVHAGDLVSIEGWIRRALAGRIAVGAHPGYADRAGSGRRPVELAPEALLALVRQQVGWLAATAERLGASLAHVKPHGALYHKVAADPEAAGAVAEATPPQLVLVGPAGSPALELWRSAGRRTAAEGFADRRYEASGELRSRAEPGALITDPEEAAEQAVRLALCPTLDLQTLCVHGDTPGAPEIARAVRAALLRHGLMLRSL